MITQTLPDLIGIKKKCRITDSSFDASISTLIDEISPLVQFAVRPDVLTTTDVGILAILRLSQTEIIGAEVLEEKARTNVTPYSKDTNFFVVADRLRRRGWTRLGPYLRAAATEQWPAISA